MPSKYCLRPVPFVSESPLGVAYRSLAVLADGSLSPPRWYDHATGEWGATFDAAHHIQPLASDPTHAALQSFVAPGEIADDPSVLADVFILKPDKSVLSVFDCRPANEISAISRGWYSRP